MNKEDILLLLEVTKIINSTLDLEKLLTIIMEQATRVVKAEASSLMLLDETKGELVFDVALGEKKDQIKQIRLKVGEGVAGWVAKEGKSLIINDVTKDARWSPRADTAIQFKTQNILCVPLKIKERIIGVMEALNRTEREYFDQEDQEIFEAFAAQAAVAIENARLFKEITKTKEEIETVFIGMSDGAILTDEAYRILMTNATCLKFFDWEKEEIIGKNFFEETRATFDTSIPLDKIIGKSITFEMKRKIGKPFFLSNVTTRLKDEQDKTLGFIILLRDITEFKKETLLKQNFISLLSHKIKTPLTSIMGYSSILLLEDKQKQNLTDFQRSSLNDISEQGQALANLVNELLSFSLVEGEVLELNCKVVKLKDILKDSLAALHDRIARNRAEVTIDQSCQMLDTIYADGEKIKEVFKNLVDNALKFNNKKEKKVKISARLVEAKYNEFTVEDNGDGIPGEEFDKIFQKFYQIEESFTGQVEGAGLGLALVKRIVEAHGGKVWVESKIGEGSKFKFSLPLQLSLEET